MRLDKFLSHHLNISRKAVNRELKASKITVNGKVAKLGAVHITPLCVVAYNEHQIKQISQSRYFMLNKPQGFVCANNDELNRTVFELIDEPMSQKLHCAGRLDIDTTGLVLITDDGQWSHRITAPKHHLNKMYHVITAKPLTANLINIFEQGILLNNERSPTKPAKLVIIGKNEAHLTISEGKYHQVKRMFAAVNHHVESLHRLKIGNLTLDLDLGDYRALTQQEAESIFK